LFLVPNKVSLVFQESLDDGGFFGSAFGFSAAADLADLVRWLTLPFSLLALPRSAKGFLVLRPGAIVAMAAEGYDRLTTTYSKNVLPFC
jgi:hypothetical protein